MKSDYSAMAAGQGLRAGDRGSVSEFGHAYVNGQYYGGSATTAITGIGNWAGVTVNGGFTLNDYPDGGTGYSFHAHPNLPGFVGRLGTKNWSLNPGSAGGADMRFAGGSAQRNMIHFVGWDNGLFTYGPKGNIYNVLGSGWSNLDCSSVLK